MLRGRSTPTPMHDVLVTLQVLLLLPMLPLAMMSQRTSRAHRARHQGFMSAAVGAGVLALLLGLLSLSILGDDEPADPLLTFAPPVLTMLLGGLVVYRGLSRPPVARSPRPDRP